jgi:starch phosphorylase
MELAVDARMPTYAGGLGVLAGDTLRSCADLGVPIVGVTLLWRMGYFEQALNELGEQSERPASWAPERLVTELPTRVSVDVEGRRVTTRIFKHEIIGASGYVIPVLLLDTDVVENTPEDRRLTDALYSGDERHRLAQEIVLGIGGVRALKAAGYDRIAMFHLNEGHAALAAVELLREGHRGNDAWDFDGVRQRCVFTTHTPVPAGHDQFDWNLVGRLLGDALPNNIFTMLAGGERMNMTLLASNLSHYVNGVARKHREVSEHIFPGHDIRHITNGVHSVTWTCEPFRELFDRHISEWRDDPSMLRKVMSIPPEQIWEAHWKAKSTLLALIEQRTKRRLASDRLTIGFARRATAYKRPDLIFRDLARLRTLGTTKLQVVFAGKAHPQDGDGKALIQRVFGAARELGDDVPIVYLQDYDVELAKNLVAGVDLWLNNPLPPLEASGTSGMKAAHNGVPSLSILDGWWLEGCIEGVPGWAIGSLYSRTSTEDHSGEDARALYDKLEGTVLPMFQNDRSRWISVMQHAIALNASFFNTHRMVQQYVTNAYLN